MCIEVQFIMPDDARKRVSRDVKIGSLLAAAISSFLFLNSCSTDRSVPVPRGDKEQEEQTDRQQGASRAGSSRGGYVHTWTGSRSGPSSGDHQGGQTVRGGFGKTASYHGASGVTG